MEVHPEEAPPPINDLDLSDLVDTAMTLEMPHSKYIESKTKQGRTPAESSEDNIEAGPTVPNMRLRGLSLRIQQNIMGSISAESGHSKIDKLWYEVDPYKAEQMVRAPKNYNPANKYFGPLYFLGVLAFAGYAFYEFFNRPVIETYSITPSTDVAPIPIHVNMHCSNNWKCALCDGTWGAGWKCADGNITWTSVSETYESTKPGYCNIPNSVVHINGSMNAQTPTRLDLTACYSTAFTDGILIHVPFSEEYASGGSRLILTITSPSSELFYQQELEPAQRKSVFIGQTIYTGVDGSKAKETYVSDLFYDGKNSNSEAELRIKVSQFSTTSDKTRPGTIFDVFAAIGGFVTFFLPITGILRDVALFTYHKFVLCGNDTWSITDLFTGCLEALGISGD